MPQQELYKNIFGNLDKEMLRQVTESFPYFSMSHYYLLQQTDPADPAYNKIAGRAALHFNNPFFLNYRLNNAADDGMKMQAPNEPVKVVTDQNENKKEAPLFEPLYTTDYFASQGIKLSEQIKPDDKLGKQLKSFTDWLKTMKKVHDDRLPAGNEQIDQAVQNIAEKSNKEEEVLTESMAEVYIGQGKTGKAIEIYRKLSLLNPSKSAFFAAKIEQLKEN